MTIRDRWHEIRHPPEGVERASRRERLRRTAWQFGSSAAAAFVVIMLVGVPDYFGWPPWIAPAVVLWAFIDLKLFGWGMNHFGLTPPWQFRLPEDTERGEP